MNNAEFLAYIAAELDGAASMLTSGDSFNPEELGEALAGLAMDIRQHKQENSTK